MALQRSLVLQLLKNVALLLSTIRLLPHLALFIGSRSRRRLMMNADIQRWAEIRRGSLPRSKSPTINLLRLLTFVPEFRNLFYYRLGLLGRLLHVFAGPMPTLYIYTRDIGPGLYIQHGFATIISASAIGRNCWINQNVTLGYTNDTDAPVIGDDVTIGAGAKVIGGVTIGDRSKIGANAVVVKNIPMDATAVGVPAHVVRLRGQRVDVHESAS